MTKPLQRIKEKAYAQPAARAAVLLLGALSGRGGGFLIHKREYHRRREALERDFLASASLDNGALRPNQCPACAQARSVFAFSNPIGFRFVECVACRTIYMDPAPSESALSSLYNHPSESYLWLGEGQRGPERVRPQGAEELDAIRRLAPWVADGGRMLDIGCAVGAFLMTAARRFHAEGVELNASTADVARRNGFEVTTGRVDEVGGHDRFDLITMLQVIEHLVRPQETLREVHRLLRPGGTFYFSTPAIETASFRFLGREHVHVSSYGHVSLFSADGLRRLGERCGFQMVAHEYCGGADLALHDLVSRRMLPDRFKHRMALYNARLYYASELLEALLPARALTWLKPRGEESYQRAVFVKV